MLWTQYTQVQFYESSSLSIQSENAYSTTLHIQLLTQFLQATTTSSSDSSDPRLTGGSSRRSLPTSGMRHTPRSRQNCSMHSGCPFSRLVALSRGSSPLEHDRFYRNFVLNNGIQLGFFSNQVSYLRHENGGSTALVQKVPMYSSVKNDKRISP